MRRKNAARRGSTHVWIRLVREATRVTLQAYHSSVSQTRDAITTQIGLLQVRVADIYWKSEKSYFLPAQPLPQLVRSFVPQPVQPPTLPTDAYHHGVSEQCWGDRPQLDERERETVGEVMESKDAAYKPNLEQQRPGAHPVCWQLPWPTVRSIFPQCTGEIPQLWRLKRKRTMTGHPH